MKKLCVFGRVASAVLFGSALLASGQTALASELSYTYVEVKYADGEIGDVDADGFRLTGSVALGDTFFLAGGYQDVGGGFQDSEFDLNVDVDLSLLRLGVGAHGPITDSIDWVAQFDYLNADAKASYEEGEIDSSDGNGYMLDVGLRGLVGEAAEYSIAIIHSDGFSGGASATGFRVGGRYHVGETKLSVGLDYVQYDSEFDQLELGLRYQFD